MCNVNCNVNLLILNFKHNYETFLLTLSKTLIIETKHLNYHGLYYRQCETFVIHTETNPHNRIVIYHNIYKWSVV